MQPLEENYETYYIHDDKCESNTLNCFGEITIASASRICCNISWQGIDRIHRSNEPVNVAREYEEIMQICYTFICILVSTGAKHKRKSKDGDIIYTHDLHHLIPLSVGCGLSIVDQCHDAANEATKQAKNYRCRNKFAFTVIAEKHFSK
jgi:hypothetical protein